MASTIRKQRKTFNEINITPLTDIFLVLLIIMMVIAPMLDQQGLSLSVPTDSKDAKKQPKVITIDVAKNDTLSIDGRSVIADQLANEIKVEMKSKKDGLIIEPAGDSSHGALVSVMDAARTAGVENISVVEK